MPAEILVIGSSEGLDHQKYLIDQLNDKLFKAGFSNHEYRCISWEDDTNWKNGACTLTSLCEMAKDLRKNNGFVIAMFSPDDVVSFRGKKYGVGRDNVWLEYGLFAGFLGPEHVFALYPDSGSTFGPIVKKTGKPKHTITVDKLPFHLPSDMAGMYKIPYRFITPYQGNDAQMKLSIKEAVEKIYVKINPQHAVSTSSVVIKEPDTIFNPRKI